MTQSPTTNTATPLPIANGGTGRTAALARFRARGSGTQVFASGVAAKAEVNTEVEDTGAYFDTTNYRWGPLPAGKYLIGCNAVAGNTPWLAVILKNGSTDVRISYEQNTGAPNGTTIVESDGNDYFEFWFTNQSGGNSDMYLADSGTLFWGQELM